MLTKPQKQLLRRANQQSVEDYFASLPMSVRGTAWLHKANRYRRQCAARYKLDVSKTPSQVRHRSLVNYISASAPTHAIDGWTFLGRSIDATLRGDAYSAIHFGYYAELRAAMSLLACEGIGIFDTHHAVVESSTTTQKLGGARTHKIAWLVLRHWATLQRARQLLNDIVAPLGTQLDTWSDWLGVQGTQVLAYTWLSQWGLDLKNIEEDRELRNLASYRPSELRPSPSLPATEFVAFVESLWRLFEPTSSNRFPLLEQVLLHAGLKRLGATIGNAKSILLTKNFSPTEAESWHRLLNAPDVHVVLQEADKQAPVDDPRCHLQVVSRAALLLYLASAAVRKKLTSAGITEPDLGFWWKRYGSCRGLWSPNQAPASPQDLWADVADALTESANWRSDVQHTALGLCHWRRNATSAVDSFGAFELVAIWSLA